MNFENIDSGVIKTKLSEHYDEDAARYHERNYLKSPDYSALKFRQHYIEQMIETGDIPAGSKILDVGCGPGQLALNLMNKGYQVWGVDISAKMIEEAVELIKTSGISGADRFAVGDIESLQFEDSFFDVVVASGVIEYQKSDDKALSEMRRVLGDGGHLILNVTNRYSYLGAFDAIYRPFKKLPIVRNILGTFKRVVLRRGNLEILPERRTHRPGKFDETLKEYGFTKLQQNYFNFSPLPAPFNALAHSMCLRIGKKMEKLSTTRLGRLGGGYLVMMKKGGQSSR